MRRRPSACAQSNSESSRAEELPWSPMYVVLRRSTSMSVGVVGATSAVMPGDHGVALVLEQPARLILVRQRFDEHLQVAVEHALQLMQRQVDAVIGDTR